VLCSVRSNATFGFRGQFTKLCLRRGWIIWSPIACLNKLASSHRTQKYFFVCLLCPERGLRNRHLCWIPGIGFMEPSSLLDSWHRILVSLNISFEAACITVQEVGTMLGERRGTSLIFEKRDTTLPIVGEG
jgi:hypothetical protein